MKIFRNAELREFGNHMEMNQFLTSQTVVNRAWIPWENLFSNIWKYEKENIQNCMLHKFELWILYDLSVKENS